MHRSFEAALDILLASRPGPDARSACHETTRMLMMPPFGMVRANARPDKTSPPVATDLTMASRSRAVSSEAHELLVARQELHDRLHQLLRAIWFGQHLPV